MKEEEAEQQGGEEAAALHPIREGCSSAQHSSSESCPGEKTQLQPLYCTEWGWELQGCCQRCGDVGGGQGVFLAPHVAVPALPEGPPCTQQCSSSAPSLPHLCPLLCAPIVMLSLLVSCRSMVTACEMTNIGSPSFPTSSSTQEWPTGAPAQLQLSAYCASDLVSSALN